MPTARWIAADWGTSNLRLWAMGGDDEVLEGRSSGRGMGTLSPAGYEGELLALAGDWLAPGAVTQVLVCGMAGARQGWVEAPYTKVPCAPAGGAPVTAPTTDPRLAVRILPGIAQDDPADVMRGEETQIAGFLAGEPAFDGVLCLPGTHTKWVRLSRGMVAGFRTAMTGELFALLSGQSVLRHAMDGGWDGTAFAAAVAEAGRDPGALSAALFSIRARSLLDPPGPGAAPARLSGLLIGAELAAMRPIWQGRPVAVIGAEGLSERYRAALEAAGAEVRAVDGARLTLAGLVAAHRALEPAP